MRKLTPKEEDIMQVVWKLKKAFIRDILAEMPEPKPHYNTVSTMLKILAEKGFVTSMKMGNMHLFEPIVTKEIYQGNAVADLLAKYFDNSYSKMIAYFAKKENISKAELNEIINLINQTND